MIIVVTAHTQAVYEMMRKKDVFLKDWPKGNRLTSLTL